MSLSPEDIQRIAQESAAKFCPRIPKPEAMPEPAEQPGEEHDPYQDLMPMKAWMEYMIDQGDPQICKSCIMGQLTNWYYTELKERGVDEQVSRLEAGVADLEKDEDDDAALLKYCELLDDIKNVVNKEIRKRLEDFDCELQHFPFNELEFEQDEKDEEPQEPVEPSEYTMSDTEINEMMQEIESEVAGENDSSEQVS